METIAGIGRKIVGVVFLNTMIIAVCFSQREEPYLKDRGTGIATSMFGTYINEGEIILYPFFEYYYDKNAEYKPSELGYNLDEDFRGKYTASEGLFYIGYGISKWVMVEFEAAMIDATQRKAKEDKSTMLPKHHESGLGDVEGQIRWRYFRKLKKCLRYFPISKRYFHFNEKRT